MVYSRFANDYTSERVSNSLPVVEVGASIADAGNADCELSGYTYNCADCVDTLCNSEQTVVYQMQMETH